MERIVVDPRSWPNPRYAWYVTGFLTIAFAVSFVERMIMALMVEPIKADLGLTDFEISLLHGFAFAVFYVVAALPISRLTDHGSRRLVIGFSIALWSVATAACGLSRDFVQLFLSRIGVGIGEAGLSPASYSMMADLFPKERLARPIAVYSVGIYAGSGLAFMVGGAAVTYMAGLGAVTLPGVGLLQPWQATFLLVATPGIVLLLLLGTVREPVRRLDSAGDAERVPLSRVVAFVREHRRFFACHFLGFAAMVTYMGASIAWIPSYFIRVHDWTPHSVGLGFGAVFMAGGIIGISCCGSLVDRMYRRGKRDAVMRLAMVSAALLIVPATLAPMVNDPVLTLLLLLVSVLLYSIPIALAPTALQLVAPARMRAQLAAAYLFVATLIGLAGGPALTAVLTDYVFRDEAQVGSSLVAVALIALPVAVALLGAAMRPFRSMLQGPVAAEQET